MVSLWITIGLAIATVCVSTLGAYFSIVGLGALFAGAVLAVCLMAGSLEFAKFVLAAYLHQTWGQLNKLYRGYLVFAVTVLSIITSTGIFGFLSDAYQSASTVLETETTKLENIKVQKQLATAEIARLNRSVDEIPQSRVTKRLKMRAEVEPMIRELTKKIDENEKLLAAANLKVIEVKKKVGPLIYISKATNTDIDLVVKYLILVLVSVFDPLAICLVIASTHAIESRRRRVFHISENESQIKAAPAPVVAEQPAPSPQTEAPPEDVIVQMSFEDENENKKAV